MFDTHAHLNFQAFEGSVDEVVKKAKDGGIENIVIPGSNIANSKKGVEIAQKYPGIYAAVGIHPYHLYGHLVFKKSLDQDLEDLKKLLAMNKVVAVGEVGIDKHLYINSKYPDYIMTGDLVNLQKAVFVQQFKLAIKYKKSLIIHNRAASREVLEILKEHWSKKLEGRVVFHFCETDQNLLDFAKEHKIYIGVDGDVTFDTVKQEFVKNIPLELLVLETDSPYIIPEPLKSQGEKINQPANISLILDFIAKILNINKADLEKITSDNSKKLFNL